MRSTHEKLYTVVQVLSTGPFRRYRDANYSVFVCLVENQNAFDLGRYDIMIRLLKEINVDEKNLRIIANL